MAEEKLKTWTQSVLGHGPAALSSALMEGESTTTIVSPVAFNLTTDSGARVHVMAGPQECPDHLVNHWWMKAHGVTVYKKDVGAAKEVVEEPKPTPETTQPGGTEPENTAEGNASAEPGEDDELADLKAQFGRGKKAPTAGGK